MSDQPQRPTLLRLERRIREEEARAFAQLYERYESLMGELLARARARGYGGGDPAEALATLEAPDPELQRVGAGAAELWLAFFSCFRPDEAAFEAEQFRSAASDLNRRLAAVPAGQRPDARLSADILACLGQLWQQRQTALNARIDDLILQVRQRESRLGTVELSSASAADELARLEGLLASALAETGAVVAGEERPPERLQRLCARFRELVAAEQVQVRETHAAVADLVAGLRAVAAGQEPQPLPPEALDALAPVQALERARRGAEEELREARAEVEKLALERDRLQRELQEAGRRVTVLEGPELEVDKRLALYRRAFAELEAGLDHRPTLDEVRRVERVITLQKDDAGRLVKVLDRHHADLARALEDLHAVSPVGQDPRRFRPRGILGFGGRSDYDLRSPWGLVEGLRDCGRELRLYSGRVRWAAGVGIAARHVPRLRTLFRELVALVAQWRQKLGDPPPVSLSISLDQAGGVMSLPAILAADLRSLMRRKAAAAKAAASLGPLLEGTVEHFAKVVQESVGEPLPRGEAGKREGAPALVLRLAGDLGRLAACWEEAFAGPARNGFALDAQDSGLLESEHLLRAGLTALADACDELAALPGTPPPAVDPVVLARPEAAPKAFPPLPPKRDLVSLDGGIRMRAEWLALLARWRFLVP